MSAQVDSPLAKPAPAPLVQRLLGLAQAARKVLAAWRTPIFAACAVLFAVGLWVSASRLAITFADLDPFYIALSTLVFVPAAITYGALNFMVMARGAGITVPFGKSLRISCVAVFAEYLPIPGGALVRGGAMMREGSGAIEAGMHVTVNALLWIACAALAACFALGVWHPVALAIGLGGAAGVAACTAWLASRAGIGIALAALAMRFVGLVLAGARLFAAFFAIGVAIGMLDLYPFVFATILGSAAAIAPGGLGISEMVAAALATLSTVPPEAAFIAVGLNRVIGFAVSGAATGIITLLFRNDGPQTNG